MSAPGTHMNTRIGWLLLGACLVTSSRAETNGAAAGTPFIGVGEAVPAVWKVTSGPSNTLIFSVRCSGFRAIPVEGGYSLQVPGQAHSERPGAPDVPRLPRITKGRKGCRMVIESAPAEPWRELSNITVAAVTSYVPAGGGESAGWRVTRTPDPAVYSSGQFVPETLAAVQEFWMGTQKLARLEAVLVQYNPVTHVVRYTTELNGVIRFEPVAEPSER